MKELKQPQLGQTILTLRQEKQLTQEELVELCNLNVRTLQRIEAGDVTPRDYTIKVILNALDYDASQIESSIYRKTTMKRLQIAWIAGIVYFLLGISESIVDFHRFESSQPFYFPLIYTTVKTLSIITYALFISGFIEVGKRFESPLLKISSFLMIGAMFIIVLNDIVSLFSEMAVSEFLMIKSAEAIAFGGIDIVFGIALVRMGKILGTTSTLTGIAEILLGFCFLTVVLSLAGLLLMIPATIIEIILLHKCYEMTQNQKP